MGKIVLLIMMVCLLIIYISCGISSTYEIIGKVGDIQLDKGTASTKFLGRGVVILLEDGSSISVNPSNYESLQNKPIIGHTYKFIIVKTSGISKISTLEEIK